MNLAKRKLFPSFVLVFILVCSCYAQENFFSSSPTAFMFDDFLMNHLPGGLFYPSFIENYAPDAVLMIEESSAFSLIDNPRTYFEGDSYIHFNWRYNGAANNSALNQGAPAVLLPFSAVNGFRLQGETPAAHKYGLDIVSRFPDTTGAKLLYSTVYTDMGGYVPWLNFIIENHASVRDDRLYETRRKTLYNYFIDCLYTRKYKNSKLMVSLDYFDIKRRFNDFNEMNTTYNEVGKMLLANTRYRKESSKGAYEVFAVFNFLDRSNLDAEIGAYPQETAAKTRTSFLAGASLDKERFDLNFSVQFEKETLAPYLANYAKQLKDNDGDGFYTWSKYGNFSAAVFNLDMRVPFSPDSFDKKLKVDSFLVMRHALLQGKEKVNEFNPIYFGDDPYLVVAWQRGSRYSNSNSSAQLGLNISWDAADAVQVLARLFLQYNNLGFENADNNLSFLTPAYDIGVALFKHKKTNLLFAYSVAPYDIRENINLFLETDRPGGTIYHWDDGSGDGVFQDGEQGQVYGYTGSKYHRTAEDIAAPMKQRLLLTVSTKISENFVFNVKGILKKVKNNFAVRFDRDYGFYEEHDGRQLYFFDRPFETYLLSNYDYRKEPIYAQLLLNLIGGRKDKWFVNFSFLAHMGLGITAFGNGPGSNDIGVVDESMANPNSWINGFGRVDGDRAFLAKLYFGFYIARDLFFGASFKYRDGDPFAFIESVYDHDQWALYYATIKAEDEKAVKGGPREDFLGDISFNLDYKFKLFKKDARISLALFNLFDIGQELSEYVFAGGSRDAVELNIPRSLRLTFEMEF